MTSLFSLLARLLRRLPHFKGKGWLGLRLHPLLLRAAGPAGAIIEIRMYDGARMRIDLRSRTERRAFWTGRYDDALARRFAGALPAGATALDVGANIGFHAIPLARALARTGGRLWAFEPVPSNHARLVDCIRLNGLEPVARALPIALGEAEGTVFLRLEGDGGAVTGNAAIVAGGEGTPSRMAALDALAAELGIDRCDFIKVDIEGAELRFLKGALAFLGKHRPVIYGEFNSLYLSRNGCSFRDVHALLSPMGYRFFEQSGAAEFRPMAEPREGMENVLIAPSETSAATLRRWGVR